MLAFRPGSGQCNRGLFRGPSTALQFSFIGVRMPLFRIMKRLFTWVFERPKVLNCLQLSLTIARI
jgi:hypothetical protein